MSGLEGLSREELIVVILRQEEAICSLAEQVAALSAELEKLRSEPPSGVAGAPPVWVKPSRKERGAKDRKKRKHSFGRKRETPTEVLCHAVDICPDCGRKLSGGWVHDRRQVIELPETPVRVIEHVLVARRCGVCGKRYIPTLELSGQVVGKCRFGVRLMSVVSSMAISCRMPHRVIQRSLDGLYGLKISVGEISEILHKVGERGQGAYDGLLSQIRGSPALNADETGWREDGVNGYIWSFSTPDVRCFLYDHSRGSKVVKEVLGDEFAGTLVSDFYGAYNIYEGVKQRCWVHLLGDLKGLVEKHPDDKRVSRWAGRVKSLYERAKKAAEADLRQDKRVRFRQLFESKALQLALPYVNSEDAPQRVLAKRIDGFLGELFTFVDHPGVPSENNAAERAIRPAVIARKVCGGTRSPKGSKTRMTLMSLFGTWSLRGQNPIRACQAMIATSEQSSTHRI